MDGAVAWRSSAAQGKGTCTCRHHPRLAKCVRDSAKAPRAQEAAPAFDHRCSQVADARDAPHRSHDSSAHYDIWDLVNVRS
jgi:hypothetical protein